MAQHRFTDRWLQSPYLAPSHGRVEFTDELCPCLQLRVTQRGTKTFSAMVRMDGRLERHTIGRYPLVTLHEARSATLAMLRNAAAGVEPRKPAAAPVVSLNFAGMVELYTERHLKPNARSWKNISRALDHPSLRRLRSRPIETVTKREIIEVIDGIMGNGKPQSAVNLLRYLKMVFNWAVDRDLLEVNPCERIRPPAKTNERDRVLSDPEIAAVWDATFQLPTPYGEMYRIFFLTGQRRSEVSTMRWSEIVGDLWTIPRERVKKDRPHTVPLSATAQRILTELAGLPRFEDDGFVFSTTGGKSASSNFAKVKRQLDQLSDTNGWTIHDIRRTVRSKLAELGVPREVARKVLNHEDGKVDRIYNRHEYLAEKREALERWEKILISSIQRG